MGSVHSIVKKIKRYGARRRVLHVRSIVETIERIQVYGLSVVRFGDGEMNLMAGGPTSYQAFDKALSDALIRLARARDEKLLICVPDVFSGLSGFTSQSRAFWQQSLEEYRYKWLTFFDGTRVYGNAFLSRPYMDFQDWGQSARCFELLKTIWAGRRVIMVEGRLTRFGVGNDLLESAHSVRRIICPERNAYRQYRRILDAIPQPDASTLVLVALGPTAKPLVHELAGRGYQAIDIGHLDIEYEWFLRKATRKILIPGKYVDEVDPKLGGFSDEDEEVTTDIITPDYPRQVIVRIGED